MSPQRLIHQPIDREVFFPTLQLPAVTKREQIERKEISKCSNGNIHPSTAILVVNNEGRMVSLNRKFISMWNLSQAIVSSRDDRQAIELVSKQFEDPASFFEDTLRIYEELDLEICDLIQLKDGQVFQRMTKPQWLDDRIVGRIWQFRQVI